MKKWLLGALLALPLAGAGLAYTQARVDADQPQQSAFICPVTGEELPCPNCCPLNGKSNEARASEAKPVSAAVAPDTDGYICPLTGEELPCPNCCPANGK